jgi:hypothetical protein
MRVRLAAIDAPSGPVSMRICGRNGTPPEWSLRAGPPRHTIIVRECEILHRNHPIHIRGIIPYS